MFSRGGLLPAIKHDLGAIIQDLETLQRVRLPDAARRALYQVGPRMRQFHAREMASVFRDPVPFTLRSVCYRVDTEALSLMLSISEDGTPGQSPAHYLEPVFRQRGSARGTALTTRFARQLQRVGQISGGSYLVPNVKARLAETRRGRISPAMYQRALSQLGANEYAPSKPRGGERFFAIDRTTSSALKPGIYRAKANVVSQLFTLLDSPPSVPRRYDWVTASIDEFTDQVEARMARLLAR